MPTWATTWFIAGFVALGLRAGAGVAALPAVAIALAVSGTFHAFALAVLRFARIDAGHQAWSWWDPLGTVLQARQRAAVDANEASYERVRGNLRLMGLAELWSAVGEDDPETALLERVVAFCRRETHHVELGLFRLDARAGEIKGQWIEPLENGSRSHRLRWALGGLDGGMMRALRAEKPFHAGDADGVPLLVVNGERPRALKRDRGYSVFPLVSPSPIAECVDPSARDRTECVGYQSMPTTGRTDAHPGGGNALSKGLCASCRRYPVHGALVVTDHGRSSALSAGEAGLLESLASTVASVLEHAALFRDVKNAERFREHVLDAMMNGLVSTDPHGRIVFCNRRARDLVGQDELEGLNLDTLLELPEGSTAITRTIVEGKAHLQAEGVVRRRNDEPIPVRINLTPFRPEEGGRKGAVCVLEDLRVVRAMEEEIRHLDTLAAIGRFASSLAHEIRNPLGGIQAGIEFLGRTLECTAETQENLDVIHGEIRRLDGILRNLLTVAKPRELVLSECDPSELADRTARSFSSLAETLGVELRTRAQADVPRVHADRDMMLQVLTNLLKNALEASQAGSAVDLVVEAGAAGSPGAVISILDRGSGIPEADLPRLFEPFFSRKSNGTGLGLYVCHGLVQRHGGSLRAENRPGGGARFVVELPRVPALMGGRHEPTHSRSR